MSKVETWWTRDRGLFAVGVAAVVAVLVHGSGVVPMTVGGAPAWVVVAAIEVLVAWQCVVISRLPTAGATARRFYRLVGLACAVFVVSSLTQAGVAVRWPGDARVTTGTLLQVVTQAAGALILTAAMATTPLGLTGRRERIRFWLDAAVVMVGVGLFGWRIGGYAVADPDPVEVLEALVGPAAFMVVAFGLVKLSLGGNALFSRRAGVLAAGAAVLVSVDSATAHVMLRIGHQSWSLALSTVANLLFLAALRYQAGRFRAGLGGSRAADADPYSRLPYLAVGVTYVLLVWALLDEGLTLRAWVVLGGAIVGSTLVVVRQLAAFADNDDLLTRLNAKVDELAEARDVLQRAVLQRDGLAERLRHLAYHDSLTGLANRTMFRERLQSSLSDGETPTVLIIDLNDFKPVNDLHGHNAGDQVLQAAALGLSRCVRDSGTVARLGGDEFGVVLTDPAVDVAGLVERMGLMIGQPVRIGTGVKRTEVRVRASFGWATAEPDENMGALLHRADLAMYADKEFSKR